MTRSFLLACLAASVFACASDSGTPPICLEAEDRFAACNLAAPTGFSDLCSERPAAVEEILTLECSDLAAALDDLGKADLFGFDRGEGEDCTFDVQCDSDAVLTCRPTPSGGNTCQKIGQNGDLCDNKFDCSGKNGGQCSNGHCLVKDAGGH